MKLPKNRRYTQCWEWVCIGAILIIAALLRIAYLQHFLSDRAMLVPVVDPLFHDYWARGLVTGDWTPPLGQQNPFIALHPYAKPPGYVFFMYLVYAATNCSRLAVIVAQMMLGLCNVLLTWRLGRWALGRAAGLVAAAMMGFYWLLIYFEGELLDPTLTITITLLVALAFRRWLTRPRWIAALIFGLLAGSLALVRSNLLPLIPLFALGMGVIGHRKHGWHAALVLAGAALAIAPVTIRNWRAGEEFVLISANSGINLYIGNNPDANLETPIVPGLEELIHTNGWSHFDDLAIVRGVERKLGRRVGYNGTSRYFNEQALAFMREHPRKALSLTLQRAVRLLGPVEYSNNKMIVLEREASPLLRSLPGNFTIIFVLALGGLLNLPARTRNRKRFIAFMLAYIIVLYGSYLLFFLEARFRVPMLPFLSILAGWCAVAFARMMMRREFLRLIAWIAAGGVVYALLWWPTSDYHPSEAYWRLLRASQYAEVKDFDRCAQELEKAYAADPNVPAIALKLGEAYMQQGKWDHAIGMLDRALALQPNNVESLVMKAESLASVGRLADAQEALIRAAKLRPGDESIRRMISTVMQKRKLSADEMQRVWDSLNQPGRAAP